MKEYVIMKEYERTDYYFKRTEANPGGISPTYIWTAHAEDARRFQGKREAKRFVEEYRIPGAIRIEEAGGGRTGR